VSHYSESPHRSLHFSATAVVSFWLTLIQPFALGQETAFGLFRSIPTPGRFRAMSLASHREAMKTVFLWNPGENRLVSIRVDSSWNRFTAREHHVDEPIDNFLVTDLAQGRPAGGVIVTRSARRLSFVADLDADTLRTIASLALPVTPTGIAVADVNNDRRADLLVYDRDNPGIIPYMNEGSFRFRQGRIINPDNAVSALVPVHLNNDNLIDVVLYDWVRSEVHLVYGIGQGMFLDQATLPVEGDLMHLAAAAMTPSGSLDLILSTQRPSSLQIWEGNGLGDFNPRIRMTEKEPLASFAIADLNHDGYNDIAGLTKPTKLVVYLSAGMEALPEHLEFSAGEGGEQVLLVDVDGDDFCDALVLDGEKQQLLTYHNARASFALTDSLEYVTGLRPAGVWIEDVNGDGMNDIALVNSGSNSLSLLSNNGGEGMFGQANYSVAVEPQYLALHSRRVSTARFILSYPRSNQVSFLTIDFRERAFTNAIIPVAGETEFLAWGGVDRDLVDFFCFNWASSNGTPSLTLFQQIGPQTFIEKSFRLNIPNALLGAAVGDVNGDLLPDVAYVYRNNTTGKYEFATSLGDSVSSFRQKTSSYELPEKLIEKSYIWIADVNRDTVPDVVFIFPKVEQILKVSAGKGDGSFAPPDTIAFGVSIRDREQLRLVDFDGDGLLDIVLNDLNSRSVGWLRGNGDGRFSKYRPLVGARQIGHFAVGDLNNDGVPDLAIVLTNKGTIMMYDGRLLRGSAGDGLR